MAMLARLKRHPGTPFAIALSFIGFVVGMLNGGSWRVVLACTLIMSLFWIPVLIRAWLWRNAVVDRPSEAPKEAA